MSKKNSVEFVIGALAAALAFGSFGGCGKDSSDNDQTAIITEKQPTEKPITSAESSREDQKQPTKKTVAGEEASGEDLDVVTPNPEDADWYKEGLVYTSENGHSLEVFFDDEGMLQFAVDGLSLYFTSADNFQLENDWRIYTCDDGTMIVYYPGNPAHVEIGSGDYEGLYEAAETSGEE